MYKFVTSIENNLKKRIYHQIPVKIKIKSSRLKKLKSTLKFWVILPIVFVPIKKISRKSKSSL